MNKTYSIILLFTSVFISSISQIILKKAADKTYSSFIRSYLNVRVITAYIIFFTAVFIDLLVLRYLPVSFIPVIETSSYFFIIILSRMFLHEKFTLKQLSGVVIIMAGVFLYV